MVTDPIRNVVRPGVRRERVLRGSPGTWRDFSDRDKTRCAPTARSGFFTLRLSLTLPCNDEGSVVQ